MTLLTLFVVLAWLSMVRFQGGASWRIAQMSEAGQVIISTIVMFQFFATQIIAVVMLSTSISDEVYHRTLGVLMATPITSFQIVMGKLFSGLLQLLLYLALSIPLLAIVRVFGGVPWDFIISSLCITLTAILFAAAVSLTFSINGRRAYAVILKAFFALSAVYFFIPLITVLILQDVFRENDIFQVLLYPNPLFSIWFNMIQMLEPRGVGGMSLNWPIHCLIMLSFSGLLLVWSVARVRRVGLQLASGQLQPTKKKKRQKDNSPNISQHPNETISLVKGSPVIWKELRQTGWRKISVKTFVIGLIICLGLLASYIAVYAENDLDDEETHMVYALIFVCIALVANAVLSATTITSEKESRSWPILLATSLTNTQILFGKAIGVIRRNLTVWSVLLAHTLFFCLIGYIHWIALAQVMILIAGLLLFLTGSGLYFSARFKRTTTAVMANFALGLTLWAIVPVLLVFVTLMIDDETLLEGYMVLNPVIQIICLMEGTAGDHNASMHWTELNFEWIHGNVNVGFAFIVLIITALIHTAVGYCFALRAKAILRHKIF